MAPPSIRQVFFVSPSQPANVLPSKSGFPSARPAGGEARAHTALRSRVVRTRERMVVLAVGRCRYGAARASIPTATATGTMAVEQEAAVRPVGNPLHP